MRPTAMPIACVVAAFVFCGCAARNAEPRYAATHAGMASASDGACDPNQHASRYREMTWNEYYGRVKENAWRRGASVIWLHPPRVRKAVALSTPTTACK